MCGCGGGGNTHVVASLSGCTCSVRKAIYRDKWAGGIWKCARKRSMTCMYSFAPLPYNLWAFRTHRLRCGGLVAFQAGYFYRGGRSGS